MSASSAESLVILLHGVGSDGADLAGLGRSWQTVLTRTAFASPDAPDPFDHGPGFQWFSVTAVTPSNRPARVAAARVAFDRTIRALIERHGLADDLRRVALVGFSQGAIMALDAVATNRWDVGALVAFSGRLAVPEPLTEPVRTPALLIHGADDPVIPVSETEHAADVLQRLGAPTQIHILPDVGHTIAPEAATLAQTFLAGILGR